MPLLEFLPDRLEVVPRATFAQAGIQERRDLQRFLRDQIHVVSPDLLVISEEFGDWEDSRRRVDLLAVDRDANLVVLELKRTEDGGHVELQAIRYAAMVSAMTWRKAVEVFGSFLAKTGQEGDPTSLLLDFLGWAEPIEAGFARRVRIILIAGDFHPEVTTTVMWLNAQDLDIQCFRMTLYQLGERRLVDLQPIIPLPEAQDYQVRLRDKASQVNREQVHERSSERYTVTTGDTTKPNLPKRQAIFAMVRHLCERGIPPEDIIAQALPWRGKNEGFRSVDGEHDAEGFKAAMALRTDGSVFAPRRYFINDDQLIPWNGRTYVFSANWGEDTSRAMDDLIKAFPDLGLDYSVAT